MGAADGVSGILYILMSAMKIVPRLKQNQVLISVIEPTLERILFLLKQNGGYLPECDGKDRQFSISWCCGCPGVIPTLTLASELFPKLRYQLLDAACRAGQLTWEKGLLLRGNGLCHGISGNGYVLNNLYRTFDKLEREAFSK